MLGRRFAAQNAKSLQRIVADKGGSLGHMSSCSSPQRIIAGSHIPKAGSFLTSSSQRFERSVAVGLSGGVDSAVSAYLLQRAGWNVIGVYMQNWDGSDEAGEGVCSSTADLESASETARQLSIELHLADFSRQYWTDVFSPFIEAYANGATPNPDVLCNRHVKFGAFKRYVHETLRVPFFATGHYAQLYPAVPWWERPDQQAGIALPAEHSDHPSPEPAPTGGPKLLSAIDPLKDQSDFLSFVPGADLRRVIFPVGGMYKAQVRAIAASAGLVPASRKDSYGICFIGKRSLPQFLGEYLPLTPGRFVDIRSGRAVGRHDGAEVFTVGQRARIGGAAEGAMYVAGRARPASRASKQGVQSQPAVPGIVQRSDPGVLSDPGTVFVSPGRNNPSVLFESLAVRFDAFNWVDSQPPPEIAAAVKETTAGRETLQPMQSLHVRYRIRHRQDEMGTAAVTVMRQSQYEATERLANINCADMGGWTVGAPPAVHVENDVKRPEASAASASSGDPDPPLLVVRFSVPQRAVAPGQALVLYASDEDHDRMGTRADRAGAALHHATQLATALPALKNGSPWACATRQCLGGGAIYAAGPSFWHRGLASPPVWRE